jgi:hypothetical protein
MCTELILKHLLWDSVCVLTHANVAFYFKFYLKNLMYDMLGFQHGENVDVGLLGCNAMWTCR